MLWGIFRWSSQTLVTRLKSKESGTTYFWPWIGLEFVPTSLWGFCMHKVPIQAWQLTWWPPDSKQVQLLWWMVEFHHLKEDFESIFHPPSSEIVSNFSDTHQSKMKKKSYYLKLLRTQLWYGNDIKKESVIIMIVWKMSLYFCMQLVIWRCFNACKIDAHIKPSLCPFSSKRLKCTSSFFKSTNYCIRWCIGRST